MDEPEEVRTDHGAETPGFGITGSTQAHIAIDIHHTSIWLGEKPSDGPHRDRDRPLPADNRGLRQAPGVRHGSNPSGVTVHEACRAQTAGGLFPAVLVHGDPTADHVLLEPGSSSHQVTGLIDWADARITDPAFELVALYPDLFRGDPGPRDAFRSAYGDGPLFA